MFPWYAPKFKPLNHSGVWKSSHVTISCCAKLFAMKCICETEIHLTDKWQSHPQTVYPWFTFLACKTHSNQITFITYRCLLLTQPCKKSHHDSQHQLEQVSVCGVHGRNHSMILDAMRKASYISWQGNCCEGHAVQRPIQPLEHTKNKKTLTDCEAQRISEWHIVEWWIQSQICVMGILLLGWVGGNFSFLQYYHSLTCIQVYRVKKLLTHFRKFFLVQMRSRIIISSSVLASV